MPNANKGTGIIVAVLVAAVVAGPAGYMLGNRAGKTAATLETAAVAEVNGAKITKADLYDRMVKESGAKTVDDMVREKLVDQEAAKANVKVSAADIDKEIAKIKDRIGGDQPFQDALAQNNITLDQLRDYQALRLKVTGILKPTIKYTDEDLKKFFDDSKSQFDKRQIHARHILVATEQAAKDIRAQLDKGADFAALAKEKSTEPSAKDTGGDLGTFGPGKMVPEFDKVIFAMKKGETSQPFQTQYGWHVAQVIDVQGTEPSFDALKADVISAYIDSKVQEQMNDWLTNLQDKAKITNSLKPDATTK